MAHFSAIRRQEVSEFTMDRIIIIKLTKMVLVGNKILKSGFHCIDICSHQVNRNGSWLSNTI